MTINTTNTDQARYMRELIADAVNHADKVSVDLSTGILKHTESGEEFDISIYLVPRPNLIERIMETGLMAWYVKDNDGLIADVSEQIDIHYTRCMDMLVTIQRTMDACRISREIFAGFYHSSKELVPADEFMKALEAKYNA